MNRTTFLRHAKHGAGGDENDSTRKRSAVETFDGLIERGLIRPTVAVMPGAGSPSRSSSTTSAKRSLSTRAASRPAMLAPITIARPRGLGDGVEFIAVAPDDVFRWAESQRLAGGLRLGHTERIRNRMKDGAEMKKGGSRRPCRYRRTAPAYRPAAAFKVAALSVRSHENSGSSRPKCPYAAVFS